MTDQLMVLVCKTLIEESVSEYARNTTPAAAADVARKINDQSVEPPSEITIQSDALVNYDTQLQSIKQSQRRSPFLQP